MHYKPVSVTANGLIQHGHIHFSNISRKLGIVLHVLSIK